MGSHGLGNRFLLQSLCSSSSLSLPSPPHLLYPLFLCTYACIPLSVCTCGSQRFISVSSQSASTLFLKAGFLPALGLAISSRLSTRKPQRSYHLHHWAYLFQMYFSHSCWTLGLGPHTCAGSAVLTELSPSLGNFVERHIAGPGLRLRTQKGEGLEAPQVILIRSDSCTVCKSSVTSWLAPQLLGHLVATPMVPCSI